MKLWYGVAAVVISLLSACCLPLHAQGGATKTSAMAIVYASYQPYSWEQNGQVMGLEIDILNEALGKRMGLNLKHSILPWERAQQYVENGQADAFVATHNARRASYADASSEAVTYWEVALYVKQGDQRFANVRQLADLQAFKIGSMLGNGWVEANLKGIQIQYVNKMEFLPRMLVLGRLDVIPDNPLVMRQLLRDAGLNQQVDELPLDFLRKEMFLFISKKSGFGQYLKQFDATLQQMKQDGTLQKIHLRYQPAAPGKAP